MQGACFDVEGSPVKSGESYFDGTTWTVCAQGDHGENLETIEFMKEKWSFFFRSYDINHDKLITREDFGVFRNNFVRYYRVCDSGEADLISGQLERFFNCITFNTLNTNQSLSKDRFIDLYEQRFSMSKEEAKQDIVGCAYIVNAIDRNGDCFISFEEFFRICKSWGKNKKEFAQTLFNLIGPNDENLVPRLRYLKFFGELTMGTNKEKFYDMKKVYADGGFVPCDAPPQT